MQCKLCERVVSELTDHHLVPKSTWKRNSVKKRFTKEELRKTVPLCKLCHKNIHKFYTEIELANRFYDFKLLKEDETVKNFVKWAKKQTRNIK